MQRIFLFGLRISKHVPSLALFTVTVFTCRLLVNLRSTSQEAVIWEEFDVAWLIMLFFCIFFSVKLQFNRILSEINLFVYIIVQKKC